MKKQNNEVDSVHEQDVVFQGNLCTMLITHIDYFLCTANFPLKIGRFTVYHVPTMRLSDLA